MPMHTRSSQDHGRPIDRFLSRWFLANTLLSGVLAILWLVFRSGAKPNRLAYPCQRAAISTAGLAFGAPVVAVILAARRRVTRWMRTPVIIATAVLGLLLTVSLSIYYSRATEYNGPMLKAPATYRAQLYHVTDCPPDPGGDHFVGLSNLLGVMGRGGLKFYQSDTVSPAGGPDGIVAAGDVVVVKINYQWDQRGGTNTDLLRGLIRALVDHPDGFTGEVVVCENAQFNAVSNFDRALNNAQDHALSPHDVVAGFQAQGYQVSHYDWTLKRTIAVSEYSGGKHDRRLHRRAVQRRLAGQAFLSQVPLDQRHVHQPPVRDLGPGQRHLRPHPVEVHQRAGPEVAPRDLRRHRLHQALHGRGHRPVLHQLAQRHPSGDHGSVDG